MHSVQLCKQVACTRYLNEKQRGDLLLTCCKCATALKWRSFKSSLADDIAWPCTHVRPLYDVHIQVEELTGS